MITAKELATALRPALIRAPAVGPMKFRRAVIDSRKAGRGDIFIALKGEHADGHDFVADAAQRSATGAIVERRSKRTSRRPWCRAHWSPCRTWRTSAG
jgi:UDP-N-acetylmuramoyl-tripeptide--D-alanyl-D-alanine ligase